MCFKVLSLLALVIFSAGLSYQTLISFQPRDVEKLGSGDTVLAGKNLPKIFQKNSKKNA